MADAMPAAIEYLFAKPEISILLFFNNIFFCILFRALIYIVKDITNLSNYIFH
jgi:hypothetical protein